LVWLYKAIFFPVILVKGHREVSAMEEQYAWVNNRKVMTALILLVLSPGIAKIILTIIGIF
jgi:hypothetical protein